MLYNNRGTQQPMLKFKKMVKDLTVLLGAVGAAATLAAGCGGGGGSNNGGGNQLPLGNFVAPGTTPYTLANMSSRSACTVNAHQSGRARWTVLVYINAANNLQPYSLVNVAQMASVGSNADLNIVIQWKQSTPSQSLYFSSVPIQTTPSFVGTRRYKLSKHSAADINAIAPPNITTNPALSGNTASLDIDRLPDPPTNTINDNGTMTSDMGDYRTLKDFVTWGTTNYPADHIAVVLWDHGSGALNVINRSALHNGQKPASAVTTRSSNKPTTRGLSQDCTTGNQISTPQVALALAAPAQPIDAIIVDCSLQGTTEMAYELRNRARVYVGSEESPPGLGYPYDVWLNYIQTNQVGPCDIGANLISDTMAAYPSSTNITQSMTDLTKMAAVGTALNAFGVQLSNNAISMSAQLKTDRQAAQYFEFPEYKDLYDFADIIRRDSTLPAALQTAAGNVESSLLGSNGAILMSAHSTLADYTGFSESLACGLSIFLPGPLEQSSVDNTTGFDPAWNTLALGSAAPGWATFLSSQQQ
jgi:Clostripain family